MLLPLIAKIAGLVIGAAELGVLIWFEHKQVLDFASRKWEEFFGTREFYTLLETFFNEAAVLWFVFPLIDAIYKGKSPTNVQQPSIAKILGTSWVAAAAFFYMAVNAKRNAEKMKEVKGDK